MEEKIRKTLSESKHIYVIENSEHRVKIGISKNVKQRFRTLETQSSYEIINSFYTDKCSNSRELESQCHKHFKDFRICGEWFNIPFEVAKEYVGSLNLEFDFMSEEESTKKIEEFSRQLFQKGLQGCYKFSYLGKAYRLNRNKVKEYDKEILAEIDALIEDFKQDGEFEISGDYEELKNNYNKTKDINLLIDEYIHHVIDWLPSDIIDEICNDAETKFYSEILQEIPKETQESIDKFGQQVLVDGKKEHPCFAIEDKMKDYFKNEGILYSLDWKVVKVAC